MWVRVGGDEAWDYVTERGVVSEFWEVQGVGDEDRALEYAVSLEGGVVFVARGRDVRRV